MLQLVDIRKTFEGKPLLSGVSFEVGAEETVCLLGPSGSGKTTLLRIAAGLEQPDSGRVFWDGREITVIPAHRRGFGLMFQDYALFPHLNVFENVAFGLRMRNLPEDQIRIEADAALERVNLEGFGLRRTADLSGGEQQRVALARALAPRPKLLMLDEPLGALDRSLREQLTGELRRLLRRLRIPALYVTHDQEEAFAVGRRIALLHEGRIVQTGTPDDLVAKPVSVWAAEFLGLGNVLRGRVRSTRPLRIETAVGVFEADDGGRPASAGEDAWILLPSGGGTFRRGKTASSGAIRGVVVESVRRGEIHRILLRCKSGEEIICINVRGAEEGEELVWIPGRGVRIRG